MVNIDSFQVALLSNEKRTEWYLFYNGEMASPGRVRFTQAHELGHYILHRVEKNGFHCGGDEILAGTSDESNIESQADAFASYLLMPIDDFDRQISGSVDLNLLGACAQRYGVSITAAVLKWIQFTDEKAMMVISCDGFVDWAWSSDSALKAGAFYKSRPEVIELPAGSAAADGSVSIEREGREIEASRWFKHAERGLPLREMKLHMGALTLRLPYW